MQNSDQTSPFLGFYQQHGIIPVRQDRSDLDAHFFRRRSLYRQMGLTAANIQGRRIIEFGPGTGDNAMYLASLKPKKLVLVDGNPSSVAAVNERLGEGVLGADCEVHSANILSYRSPEKFDLVICEGTIPGQLDPVSFLRHVASFAAENGIVVVTAVSAESYLAEICRRILGAYLTSGEQDSAAVLQKLTQFFSRDLNSLAGMSRRHDDWVLDSIMHPWTKAGGELLPIDQATAALAGEFSLLSSSPRMLQDWRWFKAISQDPAENAALSVAEYRRWSMYLLDYRSAPLRSDAAAGEAVAGLSRNVFDIEKHFPDNATSEDYRRFLDALRLLVPVLGDLMPQTQASLMSYINGLSIVVDRGQLSDEADAAFAHFRPWFGRGQQYLSFLRDV